ncbi:TetR/AcrR family transcriptional regulator [Kineococcus sp. SYSU DK018]|uniref:TetR/AcrR family transcriptional regulator n=1 Tax=Kineococcus sp. SYSU DK018 TaxID=3383139 RepID=UPI003D7DF937
MDPVTADVPAPGAPGAPAAAPVRPDGRRTRWAEHRRARREELVTAALRAITTHGAGLGMDELAAAAGTSKTVLYRHFTDKEDLYLAVARRVNRLIVRELRSAVERASSAREALAGIVSTYLGLVEADPEVYRFVVSHPFGATARDPERDPVQRLTRALADETARTLTAHLRAAGAADTSADALAHGLVALIRSAADRWISTPDRIAATDMAAALTDLAWGGLSAVLARPADPARPAPEEVP